jgi:hypothetical protein
MTCEWNLKSTMHNERAEQGCRQMAAVEDEAGLDGSDGADVRTALPQRMAPAGWSSKAREADPEQEEAQVQGPLPKWGRGSHGVRVRSRCGG